MSGQLLSSKIVIEEEEPTLRGIPTAPTSVAGAVGVTERGPIGQAVLCSSFEELQATFGRFTTDADLPLAALGFFENGGSQLWVVRTTHYIDASRPETTTAVRAAGFLVTAGGPTPAVLSGAAAAPFALASGDRVRLAVNGGADVDAVFSGSEATVATADAGPYGLAEEMTLVVRFDGATDQRVEFDATDFGDLANATAAEVAAALNDSVRGGRAWVSAGRVHLASDTQGTASRVQVMGGTANVVLSFPTLASVGDGNVAALQAVTGAEAVAILEASVPEVRVTSTVDGVLEIRTTAVGPAASIQARVETAGSFGFDTEPHVGAAAGTANLLRVEGRDPGAYANRIEVEVRAPTNRQPAAFDLVVVDDGVVRESFPNLSMNPDHARYAERVVNDPRNGSRYIHVVDQLLAGAPVPPPQICSLSGGDDGLTGLDDSDFIGSEAGKTGLHALDQVQELALLLVPGRATPAVHNAMIRYAEIDRDGTVFAVLDPPADQSATDIVTYVTSAAALEGLSEYAAIYWPRLKVSNPAKSVFGPADQIIVSPSGVVAGVYARTDSARPGGIYDPPAGTDAGRMLGVLGFETPEVLEEGKRDLVYPHLINPLTTGPGLPRFIDGSRTLKGDGNFPYVAERRGVIFIERSLKQGLQFARHKNNTEGLRARVRRTITAFLLTQMNNGAFRSREPRKAFFVDVSEQLNPPTVIFAGKLIARVGLATNKPAEFIILRISQDTRALELELAAAGG